MNGLIKKTVACAFLGANLCAVQAWASVDNGNQGNGTRHQQQVLHVTGGGAYYPCTIPATEFGTTTASCADADITDLKTGEVVGVFTDALADAQFTPDGGFVITATSTWHLPLGNIVTRARVTVIPVSSTAFSLGASLPNVTHITGSITPPGVNSILSGTGRYKDATGQYRVSGAVNLSTPGSEFFNCLFLLDLDLPNKK